MLALGASLLKLLAHAVLCATTLSVALGVGQQQQQTPDEARDSPSLPLQRRPLQRQNAIALAFFGVAAGNIHLEPGALGAVQPLYLERIAVDGPPWNAAALLSLLIWALIIYFLCVSRRGRGSRRTANA